MKMLRMYIKNIFGVKEIDLDTSGLYFIGCGGANAAGKTSVCHALLLALCKKRDLDFDTKNVIREGESEGRVVVELTGDEELMEDDRITVELVYTRKSDDRIHEEIQVLDSVGDDSPEPRTLLDRLFKMRAMDPLSWYQKSEAEQHATLADLAGIDLEAFDADYNETFQKRTEVGRDGKQLAGELAGLKEYKNVPAEKVSITDLMAEMEQAQLVMHARTELNNQVASKKDAISFYSERIAKAEAEVKALKKEIKEWTGQVAKIKDHRIKAEEELAKTTCQSDRINELRADIASADATNKRIELKKKRDKVESHLNEAREVYRLMSDRLQEIKREKHAAVAEASLPVDGLQLTENGVLLNGLPFSQASTMQRIMTSTRIAMAANPTLRLLVCKHGSELDVAALEALEALCREKDFQMLVEIVTRSNADRDVCSLVLDGGEAVVI
tara:strand:- start:1248 stop:2576 length:1329 start_codon:yes stop_codon:yes gene_type:complete